MNMSHFALSSSKAKKHNQFEKRSLHTFSSRRMLSRSITSTALRAAKHQQQQQRLLTLLGTNARSSRSPLLLQQQRSFTSDSSSVKRPKAIKVKKSEARRRVEPKSEDSLAEQHPQNALTEAPQAPPPSPFLQQDQQHQQPTFGQIMKGNFFFGIGMALAFSIVGAIFSSMEETSEPGKYDASEVIVADEGNGDE